MRESLHERSVGVEVLLRFERETRSYLLVSFGLLDGELNESKIWVSPMRAGRSGVCWDGWKRLERYSDGRRFG